MRSEYLIEILTPRQSDEDFYAALKRMGDRYQQAIDEGFSVSIPDNPMGVLRFQATEVINELKLSVPPGRVLLHLNTFHTKEGLDAILRAAADLGIKRVIIISGDGGERLPRLRPETIGSLSAVTTSIELTRYVHSAYPNTFLTGVAFNPYEPHEHEFEKLQRKVDAGAGFVITQPLLSSAPGIERVMQFGLPVTVGVWMSENLKLLCDCVGYDLRETEKYDPICELGNIHKLYPNAGIYLSMIKLEKELAAVSRVLQGEKQSKALSRAEGMCMPSCGELLHAGFIKEPV
ncbi:MAG: methylenetetrahydrofolate reductase [Lentisphaerae bacterium]|nr:methylenetetrahydrofolate reductase [Lentisphaerota bacterium]